MDNDLHRCVQIPIDEKALERVLIRYDPLIRRAISKLVFRSDLRDDAYQEAVLSMVQGFCTYRTDRPFEPWLYTVVRNACVSLLRKQKSQTGDCVFMSDEMFDIFVQTVFPDADAPVKWNRKDVAEVWLPLQQAYPNRMMMLAFQWHYIDGMKLVDIARRLQMPLSTVKDWPKAVANWLHPRMLEALQQKGWEFNRMERHNPTRRQQVYALQKQIGELRLIIADLKMRYAALTVAERQLPLDEAERKKCHEALTDAERQLPLDEAELIKRHAALEDAKRKVKHLTSKQPSIKRRLMKFRAALEDAELGVERLMRRQQSVERCSEEANRKKHYAPNTAGASGLANGKGGN